MSTTAEAETPTDPRAAEPPTGAAASARSWTWWRTPMRFEEYRAMRSFTGLDGLRALAASFVLVFHIGGGAVQRLQGWMGVEVFFALSGYLITTLALREVDRTGRLDLRAFYVRRLFRITPVYLVVLAVVWAVAELTHAGAAEMRAAMPYYLTFMNDFAPHAVYSQTWTIGVEQKFYLVWPLLGFVVAWRFRGRVAVILVTAAALLVFWEHRAWHTVHFTVLLTGSLLAVLLHDRRAFAVLRPLMTPLGGVVLTIGYVIFHWNLTALIGRFGEVAMIPFIGLAVCLLLPAVLGPGPTRWLLSRRPLAFTGQRSYALYLVQFLAYTAAVALVPALGGHHSVPAALVTWVIALVMADLLLRTVEQPMIRVGKRVAGRRPARAAAPSPAEGTGPEKVEGTDQVTVTSPDAAARPTAPTTSPAEG